MKLHIWTDEVSYLAVCHADTVAEARALLKPEVGGGDGSCHERAKAWKAISENTSSPYNGRIAAFCLSDSAEVREQLDYSDKVSADRDLLRAQLAAMTARAERAEQAAIDLAKEVEIRSILEHVERERNTLAAQLAAANERAEKAEAERADALRCSGENAKAWQEAVCDEAVKRTHLLKEIGLTEQQRDALAARVAELEAALRDARPHAGHGPGSPPVRAIDAALTRTPPQSLARVKAAALREFAQWADDQTKDEEDSFFRGLTTANDAREWANQLETEASKKENDHASY